MKRIISFFRDKQNEQAKNKFWRIVLSFADLGVFIYALHNYLSVYLVRAEKTLHGQRTAAEGFWGFVSGSRYSTSLGLWRTIPVSIFDNTERVYIWGYHHCSDQLLVWLITVVYIVIVLWFLFVLRRIVEAVRTKASDNIHHRINTIALSVIFIATLLPNHACNEASACFAAMCHSVLMCLPYVLMPTVKVVRAIPSAIANSKKARAAKKAQASLSQIPVSQLPKTEAWDCACGERNISSNFCPECGTKKPSTNTTWRCSHCGASGIESKFCPNCGAKKPE